MDRAGLLMCLHLAGCNRNRAAHIAGVSRATFYRAVKRHGIVAPHPFHAAGGFTAYVHAAKRTDSRNPRA